MDRRSVLRKWLPLRVQDALRVAVDHVSPARRRAARQQFAAQDDSLARRVSPEARVLSGPFEGLVLPLHASWGGLSARLAGTYERELNAAVDDVVAARPPCLIDVGCAEGYYAVGFARRLPNTRVLAFDLDPVARRQCVQTVRLNAVDNVTVRGRIDPTLLQRLVMPGTVVLSDCEGYEFELIDPDAVPALRSAWMIVELHEFAVPGVTASILARFSATHDIQLIDAVPRRVADAPALAHLAHDQINAAIREGRPTENGPMQWAVMRPSGA